jgi:hypothetical protein
VGVNEYIYQRRRIKSLIVYELKCSDGHRFEGWFKDRSAFEEQRTKKEIACPVCGSTDISLMLSSVAIKGKDSQSLSEKIKDGRAALKTIRRIQEYFNENFEEVGDKFSEIALRIHHGEEEGRNIKGVATESDEEMLREEGVQYIKIKFPKYDG